jgi:hypothetical protein
LYYRPRQRSSADGLAEIAPHESLTRLDGLNRDTRRKIIGAMKLAFIRRRGSNPFSSYDLCLHRAIPRLGTPQR